MLQSDTCFNTKEKKRKRNETKQNKTKQTKQNKTKKKTNKQNKQTKQSVCILLFDQLYVHTTADQERIFVSEREDKGWFGGPRKIFDQQLAYEWYLESLNFKPI